MDTRVQPSGGDNRQMMEQRQAMDARLAGDERRRREATTINNLQQQIDELRALVRDQVSRVGRGDEMVKSVEAQISEVRSNLDEHRRGMTQYAQARQLDENRIRGALAEMHQGITESHTSIRTVQSQVIELIEQSRSRRDTTDVTARRFEELQGQINRTAAQQDRVMDVMKTLRESIDEVRVEGAQARRDYQRVEDAIRIVDSEAKRRVVEIEQRIEVLPPRIEENIKRIAGIENLLKGLGDEFARIHHNLQSLATVDIRQEEIYTTFNEQALERHDLVLERLEEVRQQGDAMARDLRHAAEERDAFLSSRVDVSDDSLRDVAHRISLVNTRVDEVGMRIADSRKEFARAVDLQARMRLKAVQEEMEETAEFTRTIISSDGAMSDPPAPRPLPRTNYASNGRG